MILLALKGFFSHFFALLFSLFLDFNSDDPFNKHFSVYKNKYLVSSCHSESSSIYGFWRLFVLFWGTLKHKRVGQKHSAYRQILNKYQFTLRLFIKHLNPLSPPQQPVFHGDNVICRSIKQARIWPSPSAGGDVSYCAGSQWVNIDSILLPSIQA